MHKGLGRVNVKGLYPATKQQGYGREKQRGRNHGRVELLVEEREVGRESNGSPAMTERGYRLGRRRAHSHGRTALQV